MITRITARDGHQLDAYLARPRGMPRAGLVIAQEMYGLTSYLQDTCEHWAGHGYLTIAPALYDRRRRGFVLQYNKADHDLAQSIYTAWDWDLALDDLDAGKATVLAEGEVAAVGIMGFCWGGSLAWLAACRREYAASVAYYGSKMPDHAHERPRCPVVALIGDRDSTMPPDRIAHFRATRPEVPVRMYAGAQHGFDNATRTERYHAEACSTARADALAFLRKHLG